MSGLSIYYTVILVSAALYSFLSAAQTAINSARRLTIEALGKNGDIRALRSLNILNSTGDVNILITAIFHVSVALLTILFVFLFVEEEYSIFELHGFTVLLSTLLILLLCRIIPVVIAKVYPEAVLLFCSLPVTYMLRLFYPLIKTMNALTGITSAALGINKNHVSYFSVTADIGRCLPVEKNDIIVDDEKSAYLSEILSFKNASAYEIMIPDSDIISVDINDSYKNAVAIIEKTGFSRLPVYKSEKNNFAGYIYYKDLLKKPASSIEDILIEPVYIPETKNVLDIYIKMQKEKIPLLFVSDEYGNTSGMLTFEDIAEEIVGEIQTGDHPSETIITKITEKKYLLSGRLDIDYFQRYFNIEINKKHYETLAGFLMSLTGDIPEKGDHIKFGDYEFIIEETRQRVIEKILFILPGQRK